MDVPEHLRPVLEALRRAFPNGVSQNDYPALLVALSDDFSEENLGLVVGALTGRDPIIVVNDSADVLSRHQPAPEKVRELTELLKGVDFE